MTWEDVCAFALSLPGVEVSTSYGSPSLKVKGKFLTRLRHEDASLVFVDVSFDEREFLMEADPETFHITPHYKDYPSVLARIERIDPGSARNFIERRWRNVAPKKLIKDYDAGRLASAG